mmetsp:Transcript_26786/g.42054  ORF Transcript_26786/g.42054 Transcript_26786/m.42054 type:complete len:322 (-) Transcript_26786:227-1192(-)
MQRVLVHDVHAQILPPERGGPAVLADFGLLLEARGLALQAEDAVRVLAPHGVHAPQAAPLLAPKPQRARGQEVHLHEHLPGRPALVVQLEQLLHGRVRGRVHVGQDAELAGADEVVVAHVLVPALEHHVVRPVRAVVPHQDLLVLEVRVAAAVLDGLPALVVGAVGWRAHEELHVRVLLAHQVRAAQVAALVHREAGHAHARRLEGELQVDLPVVLGALGEDQREHAVGGLVGVRRQQGQQRDRGRGAPLVLEHVLVQHVNSHEHVAIFIVLIRINQVELNDFILEVWISTTSLCYLALFHYHSITVLIFLFSSNSRTPKG